MQLNENDVSYLIDIVYCILYIAEFTKSIEYHQFEKEKMRKLAVERQLEIIGQAANKISKETQDLMNEIPWGTIVGLRNKLAHDYGEILAERIWIIAKTSVQELLGQIEKIDEIKGYINKRHNST